MTRFEQFKNLNLDCSRIGLGNGPSQGGYFCTPIGARVFGWAGVDGIHYCFLPQWGEMVFAVSPMNQPGDYVHPLAKSFQDFLRLVLACGGPDALEQAHAWEQAQFDTYLLENPPLPAQTAVLAILQDKLTLTPMARPFAYLKELQAAFDYRRIPYAAGCMAPESPKEAAPPWNVYFRGNFWSHHGRGRPGREIQVCRQFVWGETIWHIPALYACGAGLVADFCVEVPPARIRAFLDRWQLPGGAADRVSEEERERMDAENPLHLDFNATITLNRRTLPQKSGCSVAWFPASCLPQGCHGQQEAQGILDHYGLDPARGWVFYRVTFPWATRKKPVIQSLKLTLAQEPVALPGIHFPSPGPGESVSFPHPLTGAAHTLTVQEYEAHQLDHASLLEEPYAYPSHCTSMTYTLSPDLPDRAVTVCDCARSDEPRRKTDGPRASASPGAADGGMVCPILFCSDGAASHRHTAFSALHFDPVDRVEWRVVFHEKQWEDTEVAISLPSRGQG